MQSRRALTDHEKRVVAYHEAGHALCGELLTSVDRVHRISIVPRGRGARLHAQPARGGPLPEDARGADRLHDDAAGRPGGRAARVRLDHHRRLATTSSAWPRSPTRWCSTTRWARARARCARSTRAPPRRPAGSATPRCASSPTRPSGPRTSILDSHRAELDAARHDAADQRGARAQGHRPDHGRRPARRPVADRRAVGRGRHRAEPGQPAPLPSRK